METVTVALPVWRDEGTLEKACACILAQTWRELDVLIILNGSDGATEEMAARLEGADKRVRVLRMMKPNLAAALNLAVRQARGELLARMDADDECPPERISRQVTFIKETPGVVAVGCAYDVVGPRGRLFTVRPPTDPAEARWRLMLGNMFAHGSMLLRKRAVMEVGGYDERCERAQDFDLWLRLSKRWGLAAVPEVLYTHRVRDEDATRSTAAQSEVAAGAILGAWQQLPPASGAAEGALLGAMSEAMSRGADPAGALAAIERVLAQGPTREGLLAWLWARHVAPPAAAQAAAMARRARVREVCGALMRESVTGLWLWGAGDHTRQVLEHPEDLCLPVRGIVDDCVRGERFGLLVCGPEMLKAGDVVLLSSDWHEGAMWEGSAGVRERGVRVVRLYG